MDFSAIKDMYVGSHPVQSAWLNGNKVWERKPSVDVQAIMDAMVLWYDIKKQGATNESMAENPVLVDHSGNGHDATCYNFAWTEESGISTTNYPNALVSDGVDDYAMVEGLPLLNKEDGYTVIAKRKWLTDDLTIESLLNKCFLSNMLIGGTPLSVGFSVELNLSNGCNSESFGARVPCSINENDFIYQTSVSYCGQAIRKGSVENSNGIVTLMSFGGGYKAPIAFYSLLLFNRDLTPDEMNWVKTNLMS